LIQEGTTEPSKLNTLTGRNFIGWIVLALFFILSIGTSLQNSTSEDSPRNRRLHERQQDLLAKAMKHKWFQLNTAVKLKAPWKELTDPYFKDLDPEIGTMRQLAGQGQDLMAVKLYAAMSYERGRQIDMRLLQPLSSSIHPVDQSLWKIYSSTTLTTQYAETVVDSLPDTPAVYKVAKVHALEKAGVKDAISLYKVNTGNVALASLASLAQVWFWIPAVVLAMVYWKSRPPRGIPMDNLTPRGADRLAIHAAMILVCFEVVSILAALLMGLLSFSSSWASLTVGLLLMMMILAMQRSPFDGVRVSLAEMGLTKENFGANVWVGVLGFFIEMPIAVILATVGDRIFKFLPAPTHPASQLLEATHKFTVVFPLILFGSVIAPIWEELTFRGLIFPALNRFIGFVPSILVSSLLFGLIHPQGPALVLSLAWVGAVSCVVSYRTKSLVPCIVLHCLHNTAIFALTILVS